VSDLSGLGPILLVGCGKMGGALLEGWLARGLKREDCFIVEPSADHAGRRLGVRDARDVAGIDPAFKPKVVLLAVKPQVMEEAAPPLRRLIAPGTFVLSIAAGRTIASFERIFGADAAILRAMPNTPAAVGRGISVLVANKRATPAQRQAAEKLMAAVGATGWVEDESLIDAVTGLSGSGPAYVFLLVEAMAEAGMRQGLAPDLAMRLARETVAGAGELLHRSSEPASTLRKNVTSPKGTTQAALDVLMAEPGLAELMARAIEAATRRGRELAK
jgi:pyrroline-5-carboxylate reductase